MLQSKIQNLKSKITKWRKYANPLARPALRLTHALQNAWLHGHRGYLTGAGDWREYGALQHRGFNVAEAAASQRTAAAGAFQIGGPARIQCGQLFRQFQHRPGDGAAHHDFVPIPELPTDARTTERAVGCLR